MGNLRSKGNDSPVVEDDYDSEFEEIDIADGFVSNTPKESVAERLSRLDPHYKQILEKWKVEQILLKEKHILTESSSFYDTLNYVGGVDISFPSNKEDLIHACASLVVMSYPELKIVYKRCKMVHLTSIYVPEYLAFREVEPLLELCDDLRRDKPECYPQLILVDGNGLLHPRTFGLACHLGVLLDVPSVGVAKKLFQVDGLEKNEEFKRKVEALSGKGCTFELRGSSGFLYGKALRGTSKSSNPIFVSVGHRISLDVAVEVVNNCCLVRVPEPVRWADILSREYIRDNYTKHASQCNEHDAVNSYFLTLSKSVSMP